MVDKNLSLVVVKKDLMIKDIRSIFKINTRMIARVVFIFTLIVLIKTITG